MQALTQPTPEILYTHEVASPCGFLTLTASDDALLGVAFENNRGDVHLGVDSTVRAPEHPILAAAAKQLAEYFAGTRKDFTLPLSPRGTKFQMSAWKALQAIPYGATRSYLEQAMMVGGKNHTRAVGGANGKNPIAIIIPCHRVIGKSGELTGFGGGLAVKARLLELEKKHHSRV